MAFKIKDGIYGYLICDGPCGQPILEGVTQDQVPDAQHACHVCGPKLKAKMVKRKLYKAA